MVDDAVEGKASVITRHGRPQAVVLGYEEWRRLAAVPSFAKLLMSAPLPGVGLPERDEAEALRGRFMAFSSTPTSCPPPRRARLRSRRR